MDKVLHIVSFDIPFPPNYGGVIDVYFKLKALSEQGVQIILHSFQYGTREPQKELEKYCKEVHYYKRLKALRGMSVMRPYMVNSRKNLRLLNRLCEDQYPILFEGLHTCYYLNHQRLATRRKYVRAHNIEHEYYRGLYNNAHGLKKYYYGMEAQLLKAYEDVLKYANAILPISSVDATHFAAKHTNVDVVQLNAFHGLKFEAQLGWGNYALFHGNLAVAENESSALFLIKKVFREFDYSLILAGSNPSKSLIALCEAEHNIELVANPSQERMDALVQNAHMHLMYASQQSGLKLKLLNALFKGRHIIANNAMLSDLSLESLCYRANSADEFRTRIQKISTIDFSEEQRARRAKVISTNFDDTQGAQVLSEVIFPSLE